MNSTALRKAKTVYSFGLSECNRVNGIFLQITVITLKFEQALFVSGDVSENCFEQILIKLLL